MDKNNIDRFIDKDGRVMQLTKKRELRIKLLCYIAEKFENEKVYSEREVNEICDKWHSFNDYFLVRRDLVDAKLLIRTPDGREYRLNKEKLDEINNS